MSPSTDQRENREFAAEVKFLTTPEVAEKIRFWARAHLMADPHANGEHHDQYHIASLYFDTEDLDVYWRNGSYGRSKYRIRRYGAWEKVFLERKLKTRGLVTKRRSLVPLAELPRLEADLEPGWLGYWYHQRLLLRRLKPVCQIAYHRTARVLMTELGPIRLTLDHGVRTVPVSGIAYQPEGEGALVQPGKVILELKYRHQFPALFKQLTEELELKPEPVSKYRLAIAALGLVRKNEAEEAANATICLTS